MSRLNGLFASPNEAIKPVISLTLNYTSDLIT